MLNDLAPGMLATDLAYYLVRKSLPFREAHHVVGSVVRMAEEKECEMKDLSLEELKTLHALFDADVKDVWDYERSVEQYQADGGTSKNAVNKQVKDMLAFLESIRS
jgi:argininosuccinate lyase